MLACLSKAATDAAAGKSDSVLADISGGFTHFGPVGAGQVTSLFRILCSKGHQELDVQLKTCGEKRRRSLDEFALIGYQALLAILFKSENVKREIARK